MRQLIHRLLIWLRIGNVQLLDDPQGFPTLMRVSTVDWYDSIWTIAFDGQFYYYFDQDGSIVYGIDNRDWLIMSVGIAAQAHHNLSKEDR